MKDTPPIPEIVEQYLKASLPGDRHRQRIIGRVIIKLLAAGYSLGKALPLFFWELADLEPPLTQTEELLFCALHHIFHTCHNTRINGKKDAFEILKIPEEKMALTPKEVLKEAKLAYWKQFNELTRDPKNLLLNARKIITAKKAFDFLQTL